MSSPPSNAAAAAAASAPKNRIGEYNAEKKIGSGSFATVWFGTDSRNGRPVAIKSISLERARTDAKQLANIKAEIAIMADLNHPNIVRLLDHKGSANHLYLILEYSDSGDLSQAIRRHGAFPEAIARDYFRQVVQAVQYLFERQLVHRDLKPQNLLLTNDPPLPRPFQTNLLNANSPLPPVIKIADFGFARELQPQAMAATLCGSPLYMAPEILGYKKYDARADLWSLGAILYEMVVGRAPFMASNHVELLKVIETTEVKIPANLQLSADCRDLITRLLRRSAKDRISFQDFFSHPFISDKPVLVDVPSIPVSAPIVSLGPEIPHTTLETVPEAVSSESTEQLNVDRPVDSAPLPSSDQPLAALPAEVKAEVAEVVASVPVAAVAAAVSVHVSDDDESVMFQQAGPASAQPPAHLPEFHLNSSVPLPRTHALQPVSSQASSPRHLPGSNAGSHHSTLSHEYDVVQSDEVRMMEHVAGSPVRTLSNMVSSVTSYVGSALSHMTNPSPKFGPIAGGNKVLSQPVQIHGFNAPSSKTSSRRTSPALSFSPATAHAIPSLALGATGLPPLPASSSRSNSLVGGSTASPLPLTQRGIPPSPTLQPTEPHSARLSHTSPQLMHHSPVLGSIGGVASLPPPMFLSPAQQQQVQQGQSVLGTVTHQSPRLPEITPTGSLGSESTVLQQWHFAQEQTKRDASEDVRKFCVSRALHHKRAESMLDFTRHLRVQIEQHLLVSAPSLATLMKYDGVPASGSQCMTSSTAPSLGMQSSARSSTVPCFIGPATNCNLMDVNQKWVSMSICCAAAHHRVCVATVLAAYLKCGRLFESMLADLHAYADSRGVSDYAIDINSQISMPPFPTLSVAINPQQLSVWRDRVRQQLMPVRRWLLDRLSAALDEVSVMRDQLNVLSAQTVPNLAASNRIGESAAAQVSRCNCCDVPSDELLVGNVDEFLVHQALELVKEFAVIESLGISKPENEAVCVNNIYYVLEQIQSELPSDSGATSMLTNYIAALSTRVAKPVA